MRAAHTRPSAASSKPLSANTPDTNALSRSCVRRSASASSNVRMSVTDALPIETPNDVHSRRGGCGRTVRSYEQRHSGIGQLPVAVIDRRPSLTFHGAFAHIAHHTDDRGVWIFLLHPDQERLTQRVQSCEARLHERLVYDKSGRRICLICFRKLTPAHYRNMQRAEVVRASPRGSSRLASATGGQREFLEHEMRFRLSGFRQPAGLWRRAADSTPGSSRMASSASRKNAVARSSGYRVGEITSLIVTRPCCSNPWLTLLSATTVRTSRPAPHSSIDSHRHLRGHQCLTDARRVGDARVVCAERTDDRPAGDEERRNKAGGEARQHRQPGYIDQHTRIDPQFRYAEQVYRRNATQRVEAPLRQPNAQARRRQGRA